MNNSNKQGNGKKILFANFPADGHFNPLTGLAVYLKDAGYDVRWYSSNTYAAKLQKLNIRHYAFKKAVDVSDNNFNAVFPGRAEQKTAIAKLKFDIINAFILRAPEYYADIKEIHETFPFDMVIADCAFTAIPFIRDLLKVPVIAIGVFPLTETSVDLAPTGLGIMPSKSFPGKIKQSIMRFVADKIIFREPNKVLHQLLDMYEIPHAKENLFDILTRKSDLLLQSGTPGFEYERSDMSRNIRFVGALLPYSNGVHTEQWFDQRLVTYQRVVLVTQGTVEKDIEKLLVPTLEAFKGSNTLVVATTGGSQTKELKERFPYDNIIVEDFIPFADIMPYADVYITNGGYGGVMLGIENKLPMVVAGVHEGKNEICARVGYFKLGINLKTESPRPAQVRAAVEKVWEDSSYREHVDRLSFEFEQYDPYVLCEQHIREILFPRVFTRGSAKNFANKIY